ncbi:hypothetical protein BDV3_003234 [Batrachochytrium dendrobatidis]
MSKIMRESSRLIQNNNNEELDLERQGTQKIRTASSSSHTSVAGVNAPRLDIQLPNSKLQLWGESSNENNGSFEQIQTAEYTSGIPDSFVSSSVLSQTGALLNISSANGLSVFAKVKQDYVAQGPDELNLEEEDIVRIFPASASGALQSLSGVGGANTFLARRVGMSIGAINGLVGWFATANVRILTEEEAAVEGLNSSDSISDLHQANLGLSRQASVVSKSDGTDFIEASSRANMLASESTDRSSIHANQGPNLGPLTSSSQQQTRNWYNKYRAMPRYEKKSFSSSFALTSSDSQDATPHPIGSIRERSLSNAALLNAASIQDGSEGHVPGHRSEKSWWSGSSRPAVSAPSAPIVTNVSGKVAILGAPAGQRQLWVDFVGGAEAVETLGLSKKEIKRQEVIYEIITTESDYIDDLDIICEAYIKQLKKNKLIRSKDMAIIFSNIEQLLPVNMELLKSLVKRQETNKVIEYVGDAFIRVSDYLKMYTMYCSNHPYALIKLQSVRQNKSVAKFLDQCAQQPECRNLNLANFLLKPVQRVCKYPLFLRELIKATEPDHVDSENLVKALLKIETVVTIINEGARQTENVHKMLELQSKFVTRVNIVAPSRVMVKNGPVDVRNTQNEVKRREVYLFNDMLVIAKAVGDAFKLIHMIPFDMIFVNSHHDSSEIEFQIEIVHVGNSRCCLIFDNPTSTETWINAIRGAVNEWVFQKNRMNGGTGPVKENLSIANKVEDDVEFEADGGVFRNQEFTSSGMPTCESNLSIDQPTLDKSAKTPPVVHRTWTSETLTQPEDSFALSSASILTTTQLNTGESTITLATSGGPRRAPPPIPGHKTSSITDGSALHDLDNAKPPIIKPSPIALQQQKVKLFKSFSNSKNGLSNNPHHATQPEDLPKQRAKNMIVQDKSEVVLESVGAAHIRSATADPIPTSLEKSQQRHGLGQKEVIIHEHESSADIQTTGHTNSSQPRVRSATDQPFKSDGSTGFMEKRDFENKVTSNPTGSALAMTNQASATDVKMGSTMTFAASGSPHISNSTGIRGHYATPSTDASSSNMNRNNTAINKPVKHAKILDVTRGPGSGVKSFIYTIQITYVGLPTDQVKIVPHSFDSFFDLHLQLVGHFPEAAGITTGAEIIRASSSTGGVVSGSKPDAPRILPQLPGQMMFVSEAVATGRIPQLQNYLDVLLSLPPKISRSPVVLKFFR